jgi:hypothetical protein
MSLYPTIDATAPDKDVEVLCPGCKRLTIQTVNQRILLTFGKGTPPLYDEAPEPYFPIVGELVRPFDSFKYRAYTPVAQLPAGAIQAHVTLVPRPT